MRKIAAFLCLILCLLLSQSVAENACTVEIAQVPQKVLETTVCHYRTWTSRPPTDTAFVCVAVCPSDGEIEITFPQEVTEAIVRPLSLGIVPYVSGSTVRFSAKAPAQLTVEVNGDYKQVLHLFLNTPDDAKPNTDQVIYFGPGEHDAGKIELHSGDTVYLDEGSIVYGFIEAKNQENLTIAGPGILSGKPYDRFQDTFIPVNLENCQNVVIRDITILEPAAWMLQLYKTEHVDIQNVKMIGACSNSDGITVQSCTDVTVKDCFVRSWDDSLVVKGYDGDVHDIHFENIQIWNDLAQCMEIGYETRAEVMEDISFSNITVLHAFHKAVISIHDSDQALVRSIRYENITVEDAQMGQGDGQPFLIDLSTTKSQWSTSKERGQIRDVVIKNLHVLSGIEPSIRIFSTNKTDNIDDITLQGLTLGERVVLAWDEVKRNFSPKNGSNILLLPPEE